MLPLFYASSRSPLYKHVYQFPGRGSGPSLEEHPGMIRICRPDIGHIRATALFLAVVIGAFWLNTRRPTDASTILPPVNRAGQSDAAAVPAPPAIPAVLCAICGKPIDGPVIVRRYDDGATDRIHPACFRTKKGEPALKVAR
jgi:hypothetical protein